MADLKKKIGPVVEYLSESTTACLITMVQGNLLALTTTHLLIASQTGVISAVLTSSAILLARTRSRWIIASVLGISTAVVDFYVHDGNFGPIAFEAVVTGLAAAILSYVVGAIIQAVRSGKITKSGVRTPADDRQA